MSDDMKTLAFREETDRVEEIDQRAEAEDKSRSEWIRDAVSRALGEELLEDRVERLEKILQEEFQIDVDQWDDG